MELPQTAAAKLTMTIIAYALGAVLLLALIVGAKRFYDHYRELKALASAQTAIADATGTIAADAGSAAAAQDVVTERVYEVHREYRTAMKELTSEDPDVASARATPVPMRMRLLACRQYATIHGLGDHDAGCDRFDEGAESAR